MRVSRSLKPLGGVREAMVVRLSLPRADQACLLRTLEAYRLVARVWVLLLRARLLRAGLVEGRQRRRRGNRDSRWGIIVVWRAFRGPSSRRNLQLTDHKDIFVQWEVYFVIDNNVYRYITSNTVNTRIDKQSIHMTSLVRNCSICRVKLATRVCVSRLRVGRNVIARLVIARELRAALK